MTRKERAVSKRLLGVAVGTVLAATAAVLAATAAAGPDRAARVAKGPCVAKKTVGLVDIIAQSPIDFKTDQMVMLIGKKLGWNVKFIDGAGDPAKSARALQSFVTQKVDMIIANSIDAAFVRAQLKAAQRAKIPVFETNAGNKKSPLFTAMYNEDETTMGRILMQYIVKNVKNAKIGDLTTKLNYAGNLREAAIRKVVAQSGGKAKILQATEVDLTNPVVSTTKIVTDMLTAHPDINAIYAVFDNMAAAAANAVRAKGKARSAGVYTYFTTPANLRFLRSSSSPVQAVADANLPFGAVIAFDQYLHRTLKGKPVDQNAEKKAGGLAYRVVDKKNVPKTGEVFSNAKTLAPYLAKWAKDFPCK
jgi:ribose transport system substrate-binding protein